MINGAVLIAGNETDEERAIRRLDAVHGRDGCPDAMLIERVAGATAGQLALQALRDGLSLHDIVNDGLPGTWPHEIRAGIDAACALVRKADRSAPTPRAFSGPKGLARYICRKHLPLAVEHFGVVLMNARNTVLRDVTIGIGSTTDVPVDTKALARQIASLPTKSIATWHNHPSGGPTPSAADEGVWEKIDRVAELFGTETLDHLILTRPGGPWFSQKKRCRQDSL